MGNIVAIVGRPNVGKSTFFNRMTETRQAIVDEVSGVTRDRHYGKVEWSGHEFIIIDTGGYVSNSDDVFEEEIRKQVLLAMEEADVIVFLVDVISGITDLDETVATMVEANADTGSPLPDVSQIPEDVKIKMAGKRVLLSVTPRRFVSWDHGKLPSSKTPDGMKKALG